MSNPTEQQAIEALKKCQWRKRIDGADVCTGDLAPCVVVIDEGKCDALIRLYYGKSKTGMFSEQFAKLMEEQKHED